MRDALLRCDLASFIEKTFHTVDPGTDYLHNWHIDLLADRLTQVMQGNITRLIINIPPRSLKSVCISVAWPAWLLGNNPSTKIIAASYSQILSLKHSQDCRLVMRTPWYRELFPDVELCDGQDEKAKFVTTSRGFRFATSVGGTVTGEGGDILIMDDPHTPTQANSSVLREHTNQWFDQSFLSRLNDKKKGAAVVVMQRLHVNDLTGHLLAKAGHWEHLCLPAITPVDESFALHDSMSGLYTVGRTAGEALHPERESLADIARTQNELGSYAFSAQYQQRPIMLEGGMVELRWFPRYTHAPEEGMIVQSWDTAVKTGSHNDPSVCTTWKVADNRYYLLDVLVRQMEYPTLKHTVISHAEHWKPHSILIEDKASGQSLLQDLRIHTALPALAIQPISDKISRFAAVTAMIESGRVFLPHTAPWLPAFEAELLAFPNAPHDDQVDSTSQFLQWMRKKHVRSPGLRVL